MSNNLIRTLSKSKLQHIQLVVSLLFLLGGFNFDTAPDPQGESSFGFPSCPMIVLFVNGKDNQRKEKEEELEPAE